MRLLHYINESFNRPYKYKIYDKIPFEYFGYKFQTDDGGDYLVDFNYFSQIGGNIPFEKILMKHNLDTKSYEGYIIAFYKVEDDRDNIYLTGSGNAQRVLATVLVIIKDFIKREEPQFLTFSAEERSRIKLYDRMIKVLSSKFGYKHIDTIHNKRSGTGYVLWCGR